MNKIGQKFGFEEDLLKDQEIYSNLANDENRRSLLKNVRRK
jgi:hypothetical protein